MSVTSSIMVGVALVSQPLLAMPYYLEADKVNSIYYVLVNTRTQSLIPFISSSKTS